MPVLLKERTAILAFVELEVPKFKSAKDEAGEDWLCSCIC